MFAFFPETVPTTQATFTLISLAASEPLPHDAPVFEILARFLN